MSGEEMIGTGGMLNGTRISGMEFCYRSSGWATFEMRCPQPRALRIPCGVLSHSAQYPVRHGIIRQGLVSHLAWYPTKHGIPLSMVSH